MLARVELKVQVLEVLLEEVLVDDYELLVDVWLLLVITLATCCFLELSL